MNMRAKKIVKKSYVGRKFLVWRAEYKEAQKKSLLAKIYREEKVFILGAQKSGTTAIAALLAKATDSTVTLDFQRDVWDPGWNLLFNYGLLSLDDVVWPRNDYFSARIIKEPELTYFYSALHKAFPASKFVMVQRDPVNTVQSVLERLKIPGNLDKLDINKSSELDRFEGWKLALDTTWLGFPPENYIASLAYRWKIAASCYLQTPDSFHVVKYENFCASKKQSIENLARDLGMEIRQDVSLNVDQQFQSKGSSEKGKDFFSKKNYNIIKSICFEEACELGYEI